jgi:uncharacterized protein YciI
MATVQFLYRLRPTRLGMVTEGPTEDERAVLAAHGAYLAGLAEKGVVRLAGRTQTDDESTFGVVVFEARDDTEALRIMNGDPAVNGGVMRAELYPFRIAFRS